MFTLTAESFNKRKTRKQKGGLLESRKRPRGRWELTVGSVDDNINKVAHRHA